MHSQNPLSSHRLLPTVTLTLGMAALTTGLAFAQPSPILINETDAQTPGTDVDEFVELYDGGLGNTALDGLVLVFFNGNGDTSYRAIDLDGFATDADGYFLLGNAGVPNVSIEFPSNGLQNGADAVALYAADAAAFPNGEPVTTANLIDAVVYGTNDPDDAELLVLLDSGQPQLNEDANGDDDNESLQRSPDDAGGARNTEGFIAAAPTPGAANGDGGVQPPPDGIEGLRIYDIQGQSHISPYANASVLNVPGIVTRVASNGFYMQDPDGDGEAATSDGLFVFTGSAPAVLAGDEIAVSGTVTEFRPGGAGTGNLTITEITNPRIVATSGQFNASFVLATVLGNGGRVPPAFIVDNDTTPGQTVEDPTQTTFDPAEDGIDFYESLEGMLLTVNDATVVGPTNGFGETWLLGDNGANATGLNPRGGISLRNLPEGVDYNPERIQMDDDLLSGELIAAGVGSNFSSVTGVLNYAFGNFELLPTSLPSPTPSSLEREVTTLTSGDDALTVATFNVENLDPNDADGDTDVADGKFGRLAAQIVDNLGAPDIVAIQEMQDSDGSADTGTTDASATYAMLIDAVVSSGGPAYDFIDIDPVDGQDGGQPGGNIRVGYLYNPNRVNLIEAAGGVGGPTDGTQPQADGGQLGLSLNPARVAPTDSAFNNSRKPVAALFAFNGERILLVNNHFSSKGGSSPIFGTLQPFVNGSEDERLAQARVINRFVDDALAIDANARIVVLGDLNEFAFEEPLLALSGEDEGTPVLTDLLNQFDPVERYTFIFEGNSQALDHVYISDALGDVAEADIVHANAEFADQATDHDPIVARFILQAANTNNGRACGHGKARGKGHAKGKGKGHKKHAGKQCEKGGRRK